jgi:hypothetical protein
MALALLPLHSSSIEWKRPCTGVSVCSVDTEPNASSRTSSRAWLLWAAKLDLGKLGSFGFDAVYGQCPGRPCLAPSPDRPPGVSHTLQARRGAGSLSKFGGLGSLGSLSWSCSSLRHSQQQQQQPRSQEKAAAGGAAATLACCCEGGALAGAARRRQPEQAWRPWRLGSLGSLSCSSCWLCGPRAARRRVAQAQLQWSATGRRARGGTSRRRSGLTAPPPRRRGVAAAGGAAACRRGRRGGAARRGGGGRRSGQQEERERRGCGRGARALRDGPAV